MYLFRHQHIPVNKSSHWYIMNKYKSVMLMWFSSKKAGCSKDSLNSSNDPYSKTLNDSITDKNVSFTSSGAFGTNLGI